MAAQPAPRRRRQRRSLVTQQKLLNAAIDAFAENGFKATSTRDIADRAGVHHPLISYHFENKDTLWRAAIDSIFRDFNSTLLKAIAAVPEAQPKARAEAFIRSYVRYAHAQPALHKIIWQESGHASERLDWIVASYLKPLYEIVSVPLGRLQELGVAPGGNPALLYNLIRVSAGGLVALGLEIKETSDVDLAAEGQLDELADLLVRVFLPGDLPLQD